MTETELKPPPITPAPITPAPITPAPITPAPITPAPITPAPITPAPITPERYERIGELFDAALEHEPAKRASFLAKACGADNVLRAEIEKLLAHQVEDEEFLARPALQVAVTLLAQNQFHAKAGKQLKHYELLAPLGVGGMGEVWLARDTQLERKVALKLLPPQFTQNPERLQRFHREARAASALNHPNIITIYEIGAAEGVHLIATEYIDGVTLRQRMAEGRPSLRETISIVRQIAEALDTAHQTDIIHRDIKPENVMIRRDGLVKVLDFGLARVTELRNADFGGRNEEAENLRQSHSNNAQLTKPGVVMGTPRYMSPEQARGLKVDARTDVFSLGVVFYEMLTGAPPFAGATEAEVYAALLEKEPLPISQFVQEIPVPLESIIRRLLVKKREDRYETIRAFTDDLAQLDLLPGDSGAELRTQALRTHATDELRKDTKEPGPQTTLPNPSQVSLRSTGSSWARPGWLLAAFAVVALLGFGIWRWVGGTGHSTQLSANATFSPLIGETGAKDHPAFSPDETRIAFAWDGGNSARVGPRDIYIKVIGTDGPPLRLTTAPEDDAHPVWTPDGKYVTFVRGPLKSDEKRRNEVIRIPASGGPEQKLGETNTSAAWSPDGKLLAVTRDPGWAELPGWEAGGGVFLLTPETGQHTRLVTTPPDTRDMFPRFSPDGKQVVFIRGPEPTKTWLWVVPVNGGTPRPVTNENNRIISIAWTSDSRAIVFAGVWKGTRGLWKVAVSGGTPERVAVPGQEPVSLDISPRGDKLIWTEAAPPQSNLWLYHGAGFGGRAVPGKFDAPVRLPSSSIYEDSSPDFSPDGHRLVFSSSRSGGYELWLSDADGNNAMRLTTQGGPTGSPRWSPDGKWIAFDSQIGGDGNIYVMSADGGPWRRLTPESTAETVPTWSRDGQWIYFKSNRSGSMQIHKMPAAGGEARQITFHGGFEGFESPDGSTFYYTKARGEYGIYAVPANGGEEKPVPELSRAGYWRSWGLVKEGICFIAKEDAPQQTIRFFSFATRRITPLITVNGEALYWLSGLALSADGKRLLFAQPEPRKDEIMLMENFH